MKSEIRGVARLDVQRARQLSVSTFFDQDGRDAA